MTHLLENLRNYVHSGPSGNDKQFIPLALGVGAGMGLLGAYIGSKGPKTQAIGPGQIEEHMKPMQSIIGQMQGGYQQMQDMGQDLMDPRSTMNMQQFQAMKEGSADQMALQNLLSRRQSAALGADSGILQGQNRLAMGQNTRDLYAQHQQGLMQSRQQGMGMLGQSQNLLGNIANTQMGVSENIAQADIYQNQQLRDEEVRKNQMWGQAIGGIGSGLMGGV